MMTREQMHTLVDWLADGKLEFMDLKQRWLKCNGFRSSDTFDEFRRTPEPPAKKLRPWTIDEIPLEHWYRMKGSAIATRIGAIDSGSVLFMANSWCSPARLFNTWEHSPNGCTDWQPCGQLVEEGV